MEALLRILHLEDEPFDSEVVRELLCEDRLDSAIERVDTLADFQRSLEGGCYDVILSDYTLPGVDTFEALRMARERCPTVPFIFVSGTIGEDTAIESLQMGASDYVLKHRPARLGPAVRRALQQAKEQAGRRQAEQALRQSQEALRRSEAWLRLAVEAADLGTWDWYPPSGALICSPRCKAIFALPVEAEPTCAWFMSRLHPEDLDRIVKAIEDVTEPRGQGKLDIEYRILQADASYRWIRTRGRSLFSGEGPNRHVVRTTGTAQDVTERKQAEIALSNAKTLLEHEVQQRTAQLRESVTELEHFSYTITHDMRAPLRCMHSFGELLLSECAGGLDARHQQYLQLIVDAAERMDKLITDALDYTKVVRQELTLTSTNTSALLEGIITSYPQLQPPQAQITVAGKIPNVLGNEAGLTQVFANLLNNAVKFVEPGKTPQIRIWAEKKTSQGVSLVRIWFEDNGIGIPKEFQDRIWVMFQRLNENYEGTGIGLSLVCKVMQRMGGKVGVESEAGQGSKFWVELKQGTEF